MPNGLAGSAQVSYPLLAPSGTAGAPSYSFAANTANGMFNVNNNQFRLTAGGHSTGAFVFQYGNAAGDGIGIVSDLGGIYLGVASDANLVRDAANVLAQRNGTAAQEFRVYGTTTGPVYLSLSNGGTHSVIQAVGGDIVFKVSTTPIWSMLVSTGDFIPYTSGNYKIGGAATRVQALFLGGNTPAASAPMIDCSQTWNDVAQIFIGAKISITNTNSAAGSYSFATYGGAAGVTFAFGIEPSGYGVSAAGFQGPEWRFASNGRFYAPSDGVWVCYNNASSDFTRLCFGGTTAAFPAIARDGANLSLVHADGSAGYIDLTVHDVIGSSVYLSNLVGVGANNTNIGLSLTGFAMNIHNSSAALTLAVTGGATLAKFAGTGYLEMYEVTAPAAPGANTGRLYFEDNGAGKTRLMCLFNTGVAQQIAIEP